MPIFGRRNNAGPASGKIVNNRGRGGATPFTFGVWIRLHGADILTMAIMGAIGLGVYFASPAPNRSFPVYFQDGEVVYPQFAYPLRKEIVPIWAAALIAFIVPFFFFTLFQARRRSLDDWLTTNLGLLKSLITAAVFQVFVKWLIGGLRPHFYAVCKPSISAGAAQSGVGFANLMYDRSICTGDEKQINDSLESMPSGHSTAAWAGLFYLALYFNAQLKVMSAHNPAYWKMILMFAPLLGATLISGALTIDEFHNWYDVLAGAIIGICTALVAFRQTFAAIIDFRFNHLLLPRARSLFHRTPFLPVPGRGPYYDYRPMPEIMSVDLPFTREGGWGYGGGEQNVGAPGDATVLAAAGGMGGAAHGGMNGNGKGALSNAEAGQGSANTMAGTHNFANGERTLGGRTSPGNGYINTGAGNPHGPAGNATTVGNGFVG